MILYDLSDWVSDEQNVTEAELQCYEFDSYDDAMNYLYDKAHEERVEGYLVRCEYDDEWNLIKARAVEYMHLEPAYDDGEWYVKVIEGYKIEDPRHNHNFLVMDDEKKIQEHMKEACNA